MLTPIHTRLTTLTNQFAEAQASSDSSLNNLSNLDNAISLKARERWISSSPPLQLQIEDIQNDIATLITQIKVNPQAIENKQLLSTIKDKYKAFTDQFECIDGCRTLTPFSSRFSLTSDSSPLSSSSSSSSSSASSSLTNTTLLPSS